MYNSEVEKWGKKQSTLTNKFSVDPKNPNKNNTNKIYSKNTREKIQKNVGGVC